MKKLIATAFFVSVLGSAYSQFKFSAIPALHVPHAGMLDYYDSNLGIYLRGVNPNGWMYELGYTDFSPKQAIVYETEPAGESAYEYSEYQVVSLNMGYLHPLFQEGQFEIFGGGYAGYWMSFYEVMVTDPFNNTSNQSYAVGRIQIGPILTADLLFGDFGVGAEVRYSGTFPLAVETSPTQKGDTFNGIFITGLRLSYRF